MTKYEVGVTALDEMEVALQEHMMKIVENSRRGLAATLGCTRWRVLDQDCNEETEDRGARV